MKRCYIHSGVSISAQDSFRDDAFFLKEIPLTEDVHVALQPDYKSWISPSAARRMSTTVKMGVTAASKALQQANCHAPDAILTGTGMGCMEDTERFLNTMIQNQEAFMTPSAFIESTHNTVGARIALGLGCHAYNNTYVHGNLSFVSALLDAYLLITQEEARQVLVGTTDELGKEFIQYKIQKETQEGTTGIPYSEGASFFVISSEVAEHPVEVLDIAFFQKLSEEEVVAEVKALLKKNQLEEDALDVFMSGAHQGQSEGYFETVRKVLRPNIPEIRFKEYSGIYDTASAFGFWLGYQVLKCQKLPPGVNVQTEKGHYKYLLIYDQVNGKHHSFILLSSC